MPTSTTTPAHRRLRSSSDPFLDPASAPAPTKPRKPTRHPDTMPDSDASPRTRISRSQTSTVPSPPNIRVAPPLSSRRTQSQDSVLQAAAALDKPRAAARKKDGRSAHADFIDGLDYSGLGPSLVFHHDGPFDACAPSRNRHRTKAPILAWGSTPASDRNDPMSAAHFRAARHTAEKLSPSTDSPYPSFPLTDEPAAYSRPPPKKNVDAIAEAWGMHEPEPYEEFFGGGGYSANNLDNPPAALSYADRSKDPRRSREAYRASADDARPGQFARRTTRTNVPPPQPVLMHDLDVLASPPQSPTSGAPKRSTSIIGRFRKMRDAPSVPLTNDDVPPADDVSPPSSLENHARPAQQRTQTFLGRFARGKDIPASADPNEGFVYVEDPKFKDLPPPPARESPPPTPGRSSENGGSDYFGSPGIPTTPGGSVARRSSLLKKMKGAVRGGR